MVSGVSVEKSWELREPFCFFLKIFINERLKEKLLVIEDSGVWDMTQCGWLSCCSRFQDKWCLHLQGSISQ